MAVSILPLLVRQGLVRQYLRKILNSRADQSSYSPGSRRFNEWIEKGKK